MPDWITALAEACDGSSLRKTAAKLGVSPAIISLAINARRGREKLEFIKIKTENTLMITMIPCPVLGVIGRHDCSREQLRPFSSSNPRRAMIYRACRDGCKYFNAPKNQKESNR